MPHSTPLSTTWSRTFSRTCAPFPGNKELSACLSFHSSVQGQRAPAVREVRRVRGGLYGDKLFARDDAFFMDKHYEDLTEQGAGLVAR